MFATNLKLFLRHRKINYDVMLIPCIWTLTSPLTKLIHKKPNHYFPINSIYETLVKDKGTLTEKSLWEQFLHWADTFA